MRTTLERLQALECDKDTDELKAMIAALCDRISRLEDIHENEGYYIISKK